MLDALQTYSKKSALQTVKGSKPSKKLKISILSDYQSFNLVIVISTIPQLVAVYSKCIKVTVDGPREPRSKISKFLYSTIYMQYTYAPAQRKVSCVTS